MPHHHRRSSSVARARRRRTASGASLSGVLTSMSASPASATVVASGNQAVQVTCTDGLGAAISGLTVTASSSNTGFATVGASAVTNASGIASFTVTSAGVGTATITFTATATNTRTATHTFTTDAQVLNTLTAAPTTSSLTAGGAGQAVTVTALDQVGNPTVGLTVSGSSSNTGLATVTASAVTDASGQASFTVTPVAAGSPTITFSATLTNTRTATHSPTIAASGGTTIGGLGVSAQSARGQAGGTTTVTVRVMDTVAAPSTAPVSGVTVAASSTDTGVATVSPASAATDASGYATFTITWVANGSATINYSATQGATLTDATTVTVESRSYTSFGSMRPAGYVTQDTSNLMNAIPGTGWIQGTRSGSIALFSDSTIPDDPSSFIRMTYPVNDAAHTGFAAGAEPWLLEHAVSGSPTALYAEWRVRASANLYMHPESGIVKQTHFFLAGINRILVAYTGGGANPLVPQIRLQQVVPSGGDGGARNISPNVSGQTGITLLRDVWYDFALEMICNTLQADGTADANGVLRLWIDGVLVTEVTTERFVGTGATSWTNPNRSFGAVQWAPTYGGNGGTAIPYRVNGGMWMEMDRFDVWR